MKLFAVVLVISTVAVLCASANAGVVAYYGFEEGMGSNVVDSIDQAIDGTHNASYSANVPANQVPGTGTVNNWSFQFNGAPTATLASNDFIFNRGFDQGTLEFWLNVPDQVHSAVFWGALGSEGETGNGPVRDLVSASRDGIA
jgi:hypothetical protein